MAKDNYRIGTGLGGQGKLPKKREIWSRKARGMGDERAKKFMERKEAKFLSKETKSERIAGEVGEGLREIGGKKKPGYRENKAALKKTQKENLKEDRKKRY